MTKKITVINATAGPQNVLAECKQRVCGYARVSTKSSSQATSYLHKWSIIRQRSARIPCGNLPGCTQTGESQELKPITEMNSI